ncbi:MAG: UDP-galactose transporter [Trichoglossum hirsutum]|nr:MAG: UDP-galactose transporter [Trichoglossum hirsutum]
MARRKQPPIHHQHAELVASTEDALLNGTAGDRPLLIRQVGKSGVEHRSNGTATAPAATAKGVTKPEKEKQAGLLELIICVGGIYVSFLTWALLQERITTTTYPPNNDRFTFSIFLNTMQSLLAYLVGTFYLRFTAPHLPHVPPASLLPALLLVSLTSSLASPFGYASLKHIDYLTFILAKSCKLLPVMALHVTVFRTRYPLYKYAVVAAVTAGVAVFTLYHPSSRKGKKTGAAAERNSAWGLFLLSINLLLDGLTNSTQDHIFKTHRYFSGPQMMCVQNLLATLFTSSYLLLAPALGATSLGTWLGIDAGNEFGDALRFIGRHPRVGWDVLGFAACGAVGQVFIFYTLSHFSSLLLVTVTVTRKMLTMILSVLWFGHRLSPMQWLGVGLVFGGVGAEGVGQRREKAEKERREKKEL